jgi:adenosylhomocysteine nucleosidase
MPEANSQSSRPIGILGAMPQEVDALLPHVENRRTTTRAGRDFHRGILFGADAVVVFSRWGKVAAASTTTELILLHNVSAVVFCGIAGALHPGVARGDIVVANHLYQHDLDASPFFPPTHVPLLGVSALPTDEPLSHALLTASNRFLQHDLRRDSGHFHKQAGLTAHKAIHADIASGDRVIFSDADRQTVLARVPSAHCVEMEGAAAAQVCHEHGVPFACIRTISDSADGDGAEHVKPFFDGLAGIYTVGVLRRWLSP